MASADIREQLEDSFLSCSICLQTFNRPKALPCLHTFCADCLRDYVTSRYDAIGHFPCPICRQNIALPTGGVSGFPNNHFIIGLCDAVHGSQRAHGTQEGASRPKWSGERTPLLLVAQNNHFAEEKPNQIIRRFGQYGNTQNQMRQPTGIAVSPYTDDIFVTDSGLNTVTVFTATGNVIHSFACDCSVRGVAITRGGTLLLVVSNAGNSLLREYTIHGEQLASYGSFYSQENPFGIALTSRNQAVVTSLGQNCVHILNSRFKPSVRFGSKGRGSTHFSMPYYVAINADDELVIADSGNHRIKIHKLDGTFVREFGKQGSKVGDCFIPWDCVLTGTKTSSWLTPTTSGYRCSARPEIS